MLNWLYENLTVLTMVLGTAAVVLLVLWWQTRLKKRAELAIERPTQQSRILQWRSRQRKFAVLAGTIVLFLAALWLFASLGSSDTRKIKHALEEMSAGVESHDLNRIFAHVSDQFQQGMPTFGSAGSTLGKEAFRQRSESIILSRNVTRVSVWSIEVTELSRANRLAKVTFYAKPRGNWESEVYYLIRAQFVLDPDDQWRLKGFEVFNPFVETNQPIQIPGM
jgi:hypothetical protein